jgi:hypothetical protein
VDHVRHYQHPTRGNAVDSPSKAAGQIFGVYMTVHTKGDRFVGVVRCQGVVEELETFLEQVWEGFRDYIA